MSIADKLTYLNETKQQLRDAINAVFGAGLTELDPFRSYADFLYGLWTPELLFQGGEQGAWYDPSDISTLFQDAAGTTPVTADGDPVGLMLDKSGNGNHATQETSAARPVYRSDGGMHWLEFDGVDDGLNTPETMPLSASADLLVCASVRKLSDVSGGIVQSEASFGSNSPNGYRMAWPRNSGNIGAVFSAMSGRNYSIVYDASPEAAPKTGVITGYSAGTSVILRKDGAEQDRVPRMPAPVGNYPMFICSGNDNSNTLLYGLVVVGGTHYPEAIETYLAAKAGVTL